MIPTPGGNSPTTGQQAHVTTHGRLHMGFLDLNGNLGRRFGSIGVSLQDIQTRVELSANNVSGTGTISATGADAERAAKYATAICEHFGIQPELAIHVAEAVPPHAGLGSGTQLALAVGMGVARLFNLHTNCHEIAGILGRGTRSSIGINTFEQGGLHIDCGSREAGDIPATFFSRPFPPEWTFLLIHDHNHVGLHGNQESKAFLNLPAMPEAVAAKLCRLTLMQLIPGLLETDINAVGSAITEIQAHVGDHFSPVQGGRFVSPAVSAVLDWCAHNGARGHGQSSWGPTGFVLCDNPLAAAKLVESANAAIPDNSCELRVVSATNQPATIQVS